MNASLYICAFENFSFMMKGTGEKASVEEYQDLCISSRTTVYLLLTNRTKPECSTEKIILISTKCVEG